MSCSCGIGSFRLHNQAEHNSQPTGRLLRFLSNSGCRSVSDPGFDSGALCSRVNNSSARFLRRSGEQRRSKAGRKQTRRKQSGEAKPSETQKQEASAGKELSPTSPKEDIVAEYVKVYNTTKKAGTFKGHDEMTLVEVLIDGKDNSMIKNAAKGMVKAEGTDMPLPPYSDDNPCNECLTTAADIATATYTDNGDGTATIKLVPIATTNSKKFSDAQGNMFNVMEDVKPTVESISILKWSEGTTDDNVVLKCDGGYAEVTYDKATKMMTKADYTLITIAEVQHANILIFKDKSATAKFDYKMLYPG